MLGTLVMETYVLRSIEITMIVHPEHASCERRWSSDGVGTTASEIWVAHHAVVMKAARDSIRLKSSADRPKTYAVTKFTMQGGKRRMMKGRVTAT